MPSMGPGGSRSGIGGPAFGSIGGPTGPIALSTTPVVINGLTQMPGVQNLTADAANGLLTAVFGGTYWVQVSASFSTSTSADVTAEVYVNGSPALTVTPGFQRDISVQASLGSSPAGGSLVLSQGDVVEVRASIGGGTTNITISYFELTLDGKTQSIASQMDHETALNIFGGATGDRWHLTQLIQSYLLNITNDVQAQIDAIAGGVVNIKTTIFTAGGLWTRDANTIDDPLIKSVWAELVGGGGGAAGASGVNGYAGPGGGAGAYLLAFLTATAAGASQTITIGPGGIGSITAPGVGSSTTFGALLTALGGNVNTTAQTAACRRGGLGAIASGADLNIDGQDGEPSQPNTTTPASALGGGGGDSAMAPGGQSDGNDTVGLNGKFPGGGGGGGNRNGGISRIGGDGAPGVAIIRELIAA